MGLCQVISQFISPDMNYKPKFLFMMRGMLSDDTSRGKHYVHFIILAAQHICYASPVQTCFFMGAEGFRTL